ncbi:MAG TPA: amino acid permease [Acidimicrobiales bacterium]|jgi:amino acid transporter|nr:amino acid permease [Acidimicrobiales bacterium]
MSAQNPAGPAQLPESRSYRIKRRLLGPPLVNEQLSGERLGKPTALGVLAPDCISSSAYGTEEMLNQLVPYIGLGAFTLVLPITGVILVILVLVTLSYREVVMTYTKAGGSYVVARDNFGPTVAQIAAVALLIDYTVTVAVQSSAGTDALASAFPALSPYVVPITIGIVVLLLYGNLRGIREAGKTFALPTYFYVAAVGVVVIGGIVREALGSLPVLNVHAAGAQPLGHASGGLLMGASVFIALKSFANGGSSLTGLEAISNGVGAFRPPEGRNARRVLVVMSATLGSLVLGVTLLARWTHAIPYRAGTPTVLSQEVGAVFGSGLGGRVGYYVVQFATLLILWTGANTSFNGFPFLASFVAEDRFLPRSLTKRGHRLAFSNGIIVLAVIAIALVLVTRANLNSLVAVYAIGVFVGFTMAGSGMVKHHLANKEPGWRRRTVINGSAGLVSFFVVLVLAVTKFTEGAWVVVVLFPVLMYALIRLNRQYRHEAAVLGEGAAERAVEARPLRHAVAFVLVDNLDLATARAVQYARSMTVDDVRAVHFVIDSARARYLSERWVRLGMRNLPLELIECPDRRLARACLKLAAEVSQDGQTEVTVLLPRRAYRRIWNRFLHDQTAERIGAALSRLPHVNATIIPFDVTAALRDVDEIGHPLHPGEAVAVDPEVETVEHHEDDEAFSHAGATTPIKALHDRQRARVAGRVRSMTVKPWGDVATLECMLSDGTGRITVAFLGRRQIAGIETGTRMVVTGAVCSRGGKLMMINPGYELLTSPETANG